MSLKLNNKYILLLQLIWKRLASKELRFIDVIIICLTTASLMILHWTAAADIWMLLWRWILMLPLMYITALLSHNYENYEAKFTYAFQIIMSGLPMQEKMDALKNHIGIITTTWGKYALKFQKIVESNEDAYKKTKRVLDLIEKITDGGITLPKILYISAYSFYNIIICSNMLEIPDPYDIMINFMFITTLRYWGSDMHGLADLLNDIFIALKPGKTDLDREQAFIELGKRMKDGCYAAFLLSDSCEKIPCPLAGKVIDINGVKSKANGSKFTENESALIQTKELGDALDEAKEIVETRKEDLIKNITEEKKE